MVSNAIPFRLTDGMTSRRTAFTRERELHRADNQLLFEMDRFKCPVRNMGVAGDLMVMLGMHFVHGMCKLREAMQAPHYSLAGIGRPC